MHVLQFLPKGKSNSVLRKCMDSVHKACDVAKIGYDLYDHDPFDCIATKDYRFASDLVRLHFATKISDMMWIDADTYCYSIPQGVYCPGYPYFQWNDPIIDIGYFYVNGRSDFFQTLLDKFKTYKFSECGWVQNDLNMEHKSSVRTIPTGHFQHLSLSRMLLDDKLAEYGTSKFRVYREGDDLKLEMK